MQNPNEKKPKHIALAAAVWATYALAFIPLYRLVGPTVIILAVPPVMVTGRLFGTRVGMYAGLLTFPLNVLFVALAGGANGGALVRTILPGAILITVIGALTGQIRGMGETIERELAERKRTDETLQRRNRELALLNRTSQAISTTFDLDQVLVIVLEEVRHMMNIVACSVWLSDYSTGELVCRQSTGPGNEIARGWRLAPGEGIVGWVAQHGESLIVPDTLSDKRHFENLAQETGLVIRSILSVPLKTKQGVIGVLQLVAEQAGRFSPTDLTLLEPLAASAAITINNARLIEALRQRTTELEARNEELENFTYVASHDLRTPLVNLQGFAAELHYTFETITATTVTIMPHLDEKQRQTMTTLQKDIPEALDFINSSVSHLSRLINALSELSRLSRRKLELEPVDVNTLVQETLQSLSHQIAEHRVDVTIDTLPQVIADQNAMKQIMSNLMENALLYLIPGQPGKLEITTESKHNKTTFHIRDNGYGIAEENMHKVFAPFRRAGKSNIPGEGMGLVYAQTLIRRHGGRIWCKSEPGVGTTFTFTIPDHPLQRKGNHHV